MATKAEISRVMAALARKRAKALTPERRREIAAMGGKGRGGEPRRRAGAALPPTPANQTAGTESASAQQEPIMCSQRRETEMKFFNEHPEIFEPLAGELVMIEGERLVAHGYDGAELAAEARRQGIRIPFVFRVDPRLFKNVGTIGL